MVEKLGGVLWNNWIPCWLVLSGPSLYAFTVPNMPKREKELTQLAHDGLYAVMRKEFQPAHEPLNMKLAKLFLGTKISSGENDFLILVVRFACSCRRWNAAIRIESQ